MLLDVLEVHRRRDARLLIKVGEVTLEIWVIQNPAQAALEMDVVDDVEADKRAEKSPISFYDSASEQVSAGR